MKRTKDEAKGIGPMFPRLHVNDTGKGGPRAPPRNKMALYEQLSIPSQRFSHSVLPYNPNYKTLAPPSSQGVANERGMFFSYQLPDRHQSEKQCNQYSDLSNPLMQLEERKKSDEDDFRVPIFVHLVPSQECGEADNDRGREKLSPANPSHFDRPFKIQKFKKTGSLESKGQEEKSQKEENSKEFATDCVKAVSNSSAIEKDERPKCREPRNGQANSVGGLTIRDNVEPNLCPESQLASKRCDTTILGENVAELDKRISSTSERALPSEDKHILRDISNDTESCEDKSCRSLQMGNLERGDSVSETSVVDSISQLDITPDDVVGIIGQKRFWKARKAIANQQRVFAIQVFELHRLIKVQRLIAASPHLLLEDSPYLRKPVKALPGKKIPSRYPIKAPIPNVPKQKTEPEKPSNRNETSAENTLPKASLSSIQNGVPSVSSDPNAAPWCFNQPQGHQWLIPVMSPSEGLVYKPYPGPGFVSPPFGDCAPPGSNPTTGNFLTPVYGFPAPNPQVQFPSFPVPGPHSYFPPYGMPIMTTAAFSGSSVEQTNPLANLGQISAGEPNVTIPPGHNNQASPDASNNFHPSEDIEVQASTASSPTERREDSRASNAMQGRNVLPLFPTSSPIDATNTSPQPERPMQVIKVVPHNATSASESAARIFRSIQEERKQYDLS
ncbi:hypothetical protein CDL12_27228 [Handroanthus impetiginosus]|uniref:Protein EARLY FLOWERING 3 n=1 Tax=Handroanthus impetiginosus TaxID=429701 RepID=A0A2G9G557_9LAMI|nr:hypothetical protein CDL12_27228 [Handroanthus impetiginosus]